MVNKETDIIKVIENNYSYFSKRQRLIADFIINHFDKAVYMTASQLGENAGVSESTVVRFASELGFKKYQQLLKSLKEAMRTRLNSLQRMELASEIMGSDDILSKVLKSDIEKIFSTLNEIDKKQFDGAVEALLNAEHIYITGVRSAAALASFTGFYFNLLFDNVKLINTTGADDIFEQILKVGERDVVLGMSFPRYSKNTLEAMRYAADCGAKIIGITDNIKSPIVKYSNYCLIARSDMDSFVDSLVAPLSVLNALIAAIGMKKKKETVETFKKLEEIWAEHGVYDKNEG